MFRKTIQNIETSRSPNSNYSQQQQSINHVNTGYNTQRYDRYQPQSELNSNGQRKNITSAQFSQIKKVNQNASTKPSQLIIRQCGPNQLNTFKKTSSTPRTQIQDINGIYQFSNGAGNSSNKKQRLGIGSRKTYDSTYSKQPLQQIHYSERDNISTGKPDRNSFTSNLYEPSNSARESLFYEIKQQMQNLKQYVCQIQQDQSNELKKTKKSVQNIQTECMGELQNFANQISKQLTKQKDDLNNFNKKVVDNQRDLRHFREQYNSFVKDNQQKMQSFVLDMTGANIKKSRTNEQFGVDLKSSSQCMGGIGTSMSINFQQSQNINMKLYNEMSAQIEVLKGQLEQCKQKMQALQKDTKQLRLQKKSSKQEPKQFQRDKIQSKQVQRMIEQRFAQQRKRSQFSQRLGQLDLKSKDLYKVYQDMDSNIKGMNAQFTRVINGTVIKKQKQLQQKLTLFQNNPSTPQAISLQLSKLLQQRAYHVLKTRPPTPGQQQALLSTTQKQTTYLLDEEGNLMDCDGCYIVEAKEDGTRARVRIEEDVLYLLQVQGVQVR